jgi:hypothetical protein
MNQVLLFQHFRSPKCENKNISVAALSLCCPVNHKLSLFISYRDLACRYSEWQIINGALEKEFAVCDTLVACDVVCSLLCNHWKARPGSQHRKPAAVTVICAMISAVRISRCVATTPRATTNIKRVASVQGERKRMKSSRYGRQSIVVCVQLAGQRVRNDWKIGIGKIVPEILISVRRKECKNGVWSNRKHFILIRGGFTGTRSIRKIRASTA